MVRLKSRYLICQVLNGAIGSDYNSTGMQVTSRDIHSKLMELVAENHGVYGLSKDCRVMYFDPSSGVLCVRTNRDFENELHLALTCISSFKGPTPALARCLRTTSSVRTCVVALWEVLADYVEVNASGTGIGGGGSHQSEAQALEAEKRRYLDEIRASFNVET